MKKIAKISLFSTCTIFLLVFVIQRNCLIAVPTSSNSIIGIIDGQLCNAYSKSQDNFYLGAQADSKTHGDKMIEFALQYAPKANIYYFDASDANGVIKSDKLIEGINYLKSKGVTKINMSLSSSYYDALLADHIGEQSNRIEFYASYSNLPESFDFPAMYEGVFGVGKASEIESKENDIIYDSSNLILLSNGLHLYQGNSYLSLYEALN